MHAGEAGIDGGLSTWLGLVLELGLGGCRKSCCPEVGRVGGEGHIMLSLREFRSGKTEKNGLIASVRGVVSR